MGGRQFHKPVPKVRSQFIPAPIPAVIAGEAPKWYQSTLLWGAGSLGAAIVLTVVAAMKHDIRWLLWIAIPLFVVASWEFFGYLISIRWARCLATAVGGLVITCLLVWLYISLRPTEVQVNISSAPPVPVPIKDKLPSWMAENHWQFEPMPTTDPDFLHYIANSATYAYAVTLPSGLRVVIFQGTVHPDFLQFKAWVPCSPDDLRLINTLSFNETDDVLEEIQNKVSGTFTATKMGFDSRTIPVWPARWNRPRKKPRLQFVAIGATESLEVANLDKGGFTRTGDEIDKAAHFIYTTMDLEIKDAGKKKSAQSVKPRLSSPTPEPPVAFNAGRSRGAFLKNSYVEGGSVQAGDSQDFDTDHTYIDMTPWIHAMQVAASQKANRAEMERILRKEHVEVKARCDRMPPEKGKPIWAKFIANEAALRKYEDNPDAVINFLKQLKPLIGQQEQASPKPQQ